jgi:lipid A ethanolaminephosphotransferase
MAFYFAGVASARENLAHAGLIVGVGAGLGLGFARMAQGAHFLSHVLWSGIVCWLVLAALHVALFRTGVRGLK